MSQIHVPKGWNLKKFEEIHDKDHPYPIGDGDHGQIKPSVYCSEGIPYIRVADIVNNQIVTDKLTYIPKDVHNKNRKSHLFPNDIIIAKTGATIGKVAIIPLWMEKANTTSSIGKISLDNNIVLTKYLYYFIQSKIFSSQMWDVSKKTAQPGFGIDNLKKFLIPIPTRKIQEKIVQKLDYILGQFGEKKRKVLEFQKKNQEIFKHMNEKLLLSLISKLVPTTDLPDGWTLKPLSEICIVERGKFGHRPRNDPAFYGGKYPFIQTGNVARSNGRIKEYKQTLNEKGFKVSRMFPKGTVVITIAANIGDTAIIEFDSCFPDSIIGITPIEEETTSEYIEYVLRLYKHSLNRDASKGAQKNINYGFLKPLKIPVPEFIDTQKEIVKKIYDGEKRIKKTLSDLDSIVQNQNTIQKRLEHLQNSVLDQAFLGKLVN